MLPRKRIESQDHSGDREKKQSKQSAEKRSFLYREERTQTEASSSSTDLMRKQKFLSSLEREARELRINESRLVHSIKSISPETLSNVKDWAHEKSQGSADQFYQLYEALSTVEGYKKLQLDQIDEIRKIKALQAYRKIETLIADLMIDNPTLYGKASFRNLHNEVQNSSKFLLSNDGNTMDQTTIELSLQHIQQERTKQETDKLKERSDSLQVTIYALDSIHTEDKPRLEYSIKHISSEIVSNAKTWAYEMSERQGDRFHELYSSLYIIDKYNQLDIQRQNDNETYLGAITAYRNTEIITADLIIKNKVSSNTKPLRELLAQHQNLHNDFLSNQT
jgi:hypothetical protein